MSGCLGTTVSTCTSCGGCVTSAAVGAVLLNPIACVVGGVIGVTCLVGCDALCLKCGCCDRKASNSDSIQTVTVSKKKARAVPARRQRGLLNRNPLRRKQRVVQEEESKTALVADTQ